MECRTSRIPCECCNMVFYDAKFKPGYGLSQAGDFESSNAVCGRSRNEYRKALSRARFMLGATNRVMIRLMLDQIS